MKRLQKINKNTPTSYIKKPPDWFDEKRLKALIRYYNGGKLLDIGSYHSPLLDMACGKVGYDACMGLDWMPEKLPYDNNYIDYIVMGQLLEHMDDPVGAIKEAIRVLKVGGVLALSVPLNETEAGEVDKTCHVWSFSEQDMVDLLKPYGRYEIEILKSQFIPEYRYHFPHVVGFVQKENRSMDKYYSAILGAGFTTNYIKQ